MEVVDLEVLVDEMFESIVVHEDEPSNIGGMIDEAILELKPETNGHKPIDVRDLDPRIPPRRTLCAFGGLPLSGRLQRLTRVEADNPSWRSLIEK